MSKWLAFLNGVIVGPFTQDKIKNMFHNGEISAIDKISREGELFWKTIGDFPELQHLVMQQNNYFTAAERQKKSQYTLFRQKRWEIKYAGSCNRTDYHKR